jgi:prepilin-type N-terminal cleavage/methylation domain-containing protein
MPRIRPAAEDGLTLTELLVASAILSIVMVVFTTTFATIQRAVSDQQVRSTNNDNVRLALENLDRIVRSGNVLIDPAVVDTDCKTSGSAHQCLLAYTQANGTTAQPARCVQWRVEGTTLQTRYWLPAPASKAATVTGWRNVADGILNLQTSPVTETFSLDPDPLKQDRSVEIVFLVGTSTEGLDGPIARVEASLTARNTSYGYLSDACEDAGGGGGGGGDDDDD